MLERFTDIFLSFAGILYCQFFFKRSCYWTQKRMEAYQFQKLKKLLTVCQEKIPYYKRLFQEIGFDADRDFQKLSDLEKIPVTTKDNVRKHYIEFLNPDYAGKSMELKTSGSTGEPLAVQVSRNQWAVEQGIVWRHWAWNGYRFRDKIGIIRSYAPENGRLVKYDRLRNFIYYSPYSLTDRNMDRYLNHMIKEKVRFLRGYPSSLETLARYVLRTHHAVPAIEGIFCASEVLSESAARRIEEAFGVKAANWYGLAECIVTMGDCRQHKGLHIFEEYGYAEFLNTGMPGRKKIIGTNLHNYAMPLLRYETGDIALMAESGCSCRRSLRVIQNIAGRNSCVIKLRDRDIPLTNFYTLMEHYPQTESWQIVQRGQNTIELILARKAGKELRQKLAKEFQARIGQEMEFHIRDDGEFIRRGEGKKLAFVRME